MRQSDEHITLLIVFASTVPYRLDSLLDDLVEINAAFEVIWLGVCYISKSIVGGSTCREAQTVATNCQFDASLDISAV